ncbi:hypothetical protein CSA56_08815 [candidate division KSB3 bacterium]|uniref:Phosphagen kinase C-terminal domain-containing protein n=1 Tax=candidate division KSB3 bacterium TaxID=2044937 RepID=A0A2G6KGU0_9BACT|nr:MAG: hypothetical protein CSA56_08815 [candidate division KSB3 bacterium]
MDTSWRDERLIKTVLMNTLPYVITSRVRLARNLQGYCFPPTASDRERKAVFDRVQRAISQDTYFRSHTMISLDHAASLDRKLLEEEHLISHFSAVHGNYRAVVFSPRRQYPVVLVNEEDHLRIQTFFEGLSLHKAWKAAHIFDRHLQCHLDYAASRDDGYLTTCPSNAGSGIRASVMLFAPGLIISKRMPTLIRHCIDVGYTVRGMYGEGSEVQGYVLQISYQNPREQHAASILRKLEGLCRCLIEQERFARKALFNNPSYKLKRRIRQAQRYLMSTDSMTLKCGQELIAMCRLAVEPGLHSWRKSVRQPQFRHLQQLNQLMTRIQPAHIRTYGLRQNKLERSSSEPIDSSTENALRATLLQHTLGHLCLAGLQNVREKLL